MNKASVEYVIGLIKNYVNDNNQSNIMLSDVEDCDFALCWFTTYESENISIHFDEDEEIFVLQYSDKDGQVVFCWKDENHYEIAKKFVMLANAYIR